MRRDCRKSASQYRKNALTFSDPFGLGPDTVQIGWRPLHNLAGCCYVHFAIRVGGGNNWHADELLPDPDDSKNNIVPFNGSGSQADEYTWTTVPVPEGQTSTEFDRHTLRAVGTVGATYAGREYTNHSKGNSNKFIYDVVNAAGGKVPKSAAQSPAPKTAPGICGGGPARTDVGIGCSNK